MATYSQHYRAGKRKAAKKMTTEQKKKLNAARRQIAIQDGTARYGLCRKCAYCVMHQCSFDGSENPAKEHCENFVKRPMASY